MKSVFALIVSIACAGLCAGQATHNGLPVIKADKLTADYRVGNEWTRGNWGINPSLSPDVLPVACLSKTVDVGFYTDLDSIVFKVNSAKKHQFYVLLKDGRYALTEISGYDYVPVQYSTAAKRGSYAFYYEAALRNEYLDRLKSNYNIENLVAGHPSDSAKALRILKWVHDQWNHNGSNEPRKSDAISILEEVKEGKNFRCVEYGIVSAAALNAIGLPARVLGLKTKDVETTASGAGHVLLEVFLKDMNKWVLLDGQWDIMPVLNGKPLNAVEFQQAIANNYEQLELRSLSGTSKATYVSWIYPYLYYLDVPFDNREGIEFGREKQRGKPRLMLVPAGAKQPTVFQVKHPIENMAFTSELADFYSPPVFSTYYYSRTADSLYSKDKFATAATYYVQAAATAEFKGVMAKNYYKTAVCFSALEQQDSAFKYLKLAIKQGFSDTARLKRETRFASLHQSKQWNETLRSIPALKFSGNPKQARIVTSDIDNFWSAYDLAKKSSANSLQIFRKEYVDKGSPGLQDYFEYKVMSVNRLLQGMEDRPKFYEAIRSNTSKIKEQVPAIQTAFAKFKELYSDARFPDVYFIVGAFSSGGTATRNGLLIGADMQVKTADVPQDELTLWQKNNFTPLNNITHVVSHELIHFNQDGMADDTTLLSAVLVEGMADFLGKLMSGKTANERLHQWAIGKEKMVLNEFKKEMYLKRAYNWIANSNQETAERPADLGYWVGFKICEAYYNNATDKKQAIRDMLNIKDYKTFYEKSKIELE